MTGENWQDKIIKVLSSVKKLELYLQKNCQAKKGYKKWNHTVCFVKGSLKGSTAGAKETCQQAVQESGSNIMTMSGLSKWSCREIDNCKRGVGGKEQQEIRLMCYMLYFKSYTKLWKGFKTLKSI